MPGTMRKNAYLEMTKLYDSQVWLKDRHEELQYLLYKDCRDDLDRGLMYRLLARFESVNDERFRESLFTILHGIKSRQGFKPANTLILPLTRDRRLDSGLLVVVAIKPILQELEIEEVLTANRSGYCQKMLSENPQIEQVILIDEFLGTGQTLINCHAEIQRQLAQAGRLDVKVSARYIAAQLDGMIHCQNNGIDVETEILIGKGISDHENIPGNALERMKEIEEVLDKHCSRNPFPSLGYGESEALYCRIGGNVPNNVFPVFWWARYRDGQRRKPILTRNMSDA